MYANLQPYLHRFELTFALTRDDIRFHAEGSITFLYQVEQKRITDAKFGLDPVFILCVPPTFQSDTLKQV